MEGTPIFDELRHSLDQCPRSEVGQPSAGTAAPPSPIIVTGGPRVGKTTFVGTISDTHPINVETATDFGRITLYPNLVLYLYGTSEPAQSAFRGALGAVVLVAPRWIEDAFPMISYLESGSGVPFIVVVNMFNGELRHELDEVREALALDTEIPLITCDARDRTSSTKALLHLVTYAIRKTAPPSSHSAEAAG